MSAQGADVRQASDRRYPTPPEAPLYDNFDGQGGYRAVDDSHLAIDGALSPDLWRGDGQVIRTEGSVPDSSAHRNVLRMAVEEPGQESENIYLINPEFLSDFNIGTFSVDMLFPTPEGTVGEYAANLAVFAEVPEFALIDDPYWAANIGIYQNGEDDLWLNWGWWDKVDQRSRGGGFVAHYDTWYNLRIDIHRRSKSSIKVNFYVDGQLVGSGVPAEADILVDQSRVAWGPVREIWVWRPEGDHTAEVFIDNVRAKCHRLAFDAIEPSEAKTGERLEVTLRGNGLEDDMLPYSTEWGVSFVDVEVTSPTEATATAIIHDLAEPGSRDIVVSFPGLVDDQHKGGFIGSSNSIPFTIRKNETQPPLPLDYGDYDSFDEPARDGPWSGLIGDGHTGCGSGQSRLVYSSEAHPETFPGYYQRDGHLEVSIPYDPIGYWEKTRFAEPEGFYSLPRNMFRVARSLSFDYVFSSDYVNWRNVGLGMWANYLIEDESDWIRWHFRLALNVDENSEASLNYLVFTFGTLEPWQAVIDHWLEAPGFEFDETYTLRYDIFTPQNDSLIIDFFANGTLIARVTPSNSDFLLNQANWGKCYDPDWGGPMRVMWAGAPDSDAGIVYKINRIRGVYPKVHPVLNATVNQVSGGNQIEFTSNPVNDFHLEGFHVRCYRQWGCHHHLEYRISRRQNGAGDWDFITTLNQEEPGAETLTFVDSAGGPNSQYSIVTYFIKGWQSEPVILNVQSANKSNNLESTHSPHD